MSKKKKSLDVILEDLGLKTGQVRAILYNQKKSKPKILKRFISDKDLSFAVVSDTHLCSRYEKLDELHTFYHICKKQGVKIVFHAGDLLDGNGCMYRGNLNEIHTYGADRQIKYVVENYPKIKGITTYYTGGNHCLSFFNDNGVDVGLKIAEKREDIIYLGQYEGNIEINKVRFRVIHPARGVCYAISYAMQKYAEQIASGNKPDVLFAGHFHTSVYFWYRNMHIFQCGTFQGQTPFLARKGLNPAIGGWICKLKLGNVDRVVALESCWIPFFDEKKGK